MKKKFDAVYFKSMNYTWENVAFIKENFNLTILSNVKNLSPNKNNNVEVLFAPFELRICESSIRYFDKLKVVVSNTTSIPHIDVNFCKKKNIKIASLHNEQTYLKRITPTAEHTFGLILACYRNIIPAFRDVKNGNWSRWSFVAPKMLSRMKMGLVGYGRLGKKVETIAKAFGMKVFWFDPNKKGGEKTLKGMAKKIDILSIHASGNQKEKIIDRNILDSLSKGSIVINTARGELLDLDSLLDLLESGKISCAALDTIEGEFISEFPQKFKNTRLFNYINNNDNLLLTPHIGGSTYDAWSLTQRRVLEKSLQILENEFN